MAESSDRKELERRLEQARRIADLALDPLTKERLQRLVKELEEQLRLSEPGTAGTSVSFIRRPDRPSSYYHRSIPGSYR